ncbi:heme peroxidase [Mycena leptocephala]|nr:heme peroxidase [Mycena leptocephala]
MLNLPLSLVSCCLLWLVSVRADYHWPSLQYDALEEFLYEGARPDGSSLADLWVRLVYHDIATYNISDGTGGLDGSIFFETNRQEVWTVSFRLPCRLRRATCSGPVIPYRGGRIDANVADSLDSLKNNFAKQGFNVSEMIQLVACGHTLGGVRYPDFPTVVAATSGTVVDLFDGTQQFDHNIVTQYLDGTTQDPLIVLNQTMASDLRVFSSDNNVTMQSMSTADSFAQTCTTIFDKMLNTVPSGVTLTDEITLLPLTVGATQLQFTASVRLREMYWCDRYGDAADCKGTTTVSSPISQAMGVTLKKYQFVVPIDASQSVSKFWFVVDYGNGTTSVADNGGQNYVVDQDQNVLTGSFGVSVTAAVKSGSSPSRVYIDCFGRATSNYIPMNATYDLTLNSSIPARAGYDFYTGTATDDFGSTMQFDLVAVAGNGTSYVDAYRQSGLIGVALAAASTVNQTTAGVTPLSRWGVVVVGLLSVWTLSYL